MSKKILYLIDATAFCYRAFYALKGLSTSFGQPTNAIYGFMNMLNKILKEQKPDYLGVCFDVSRDTFRTKKFAEYKINRPPMPDELSSQLPLIRQIILAYGIALFEKQGFEADDIIATIASKAKEKKVFTVIVSSDKDILQLVDEQTVVFSPYKDEGVTYDRKKVLERFGVSPERITDIMALMGDDVDNIPGIPGVGEKTATQLISAFGSLEQLLNNIDKIKPEKIKKIISDNIDEINLNKELALLDKEVDIEFDLDTVKIKEPNHKELFRLFKYLEFKKSLNELMPQQDNSKIIQLSELQDNDLKALVKNEQELILYGTSLENFAYQVNKEIFKIKNPGENLKTILEDPQIKKIGHDLKRIKITLSKEDFAFGGISFDCMVAAYLLNPSRGEYSLTDIAWDYLGSVSGKIIDNSKAVELISQLKPRLEEELKKKELFSLFQELEMPLVEVLAQMESNGIKLDIKVLQQLSREIENRLINLIEDIYDTSGTQFNINSPKQLRQILFDKLKLPVGKKTKTGPSTDEEVLSNLADKHKLPAMLLEYRQLTKLKNTYVDTLPSLIDNKTGRVHTSFNQTATETGRLSSSNPNLQNIPIKTDIGRNIRKAIVSTEHDSCLLSGDYSQIELRVLAHLSKDENLTIAFKQDKDIHKATASLIYGLEEQDISESMREVAKRINFGIIYGLSAYGLSKDLRISVDEAQRFIDSYFLRYPKVKEYIQDEIQKAEAQGFVTTLLARRRYIPEINNKNQAIRQFAQRQAVNTPIQGTASDLIKLAMVQIQHQINTKKLSAKMILQIHDELVFDVAKEGLSELKEVVKYRMENVLKLDVPIKVDIKFGPNWLEMKSIVSRRSNEDETYGAKRT
jgi:DNA polymerase-1